MYQLRNQRTATQNPGSDVIQDLVEKRLQQLGISNSNDSGLAEFWVLEPGDTAIDIARQALCLDPSETFDPKDIEGLLYATEWVEYHPIYSCFEIVFITNDDGYAVVFFLPDTPEINADLLTFCKSITNPPTHKESL